MSTTVLNGITNAADVAATTNSIYVLDGTNKLVYRSSAAGTVATASRTLVSNTGTVLGTPTGLAVSGDTLWILDKKGKAIYRYSISSAFTGTGNLNALAKFSLATANKTAESLVANGPYFYVLENGTSKNFYRYPKAGGTGVVSRAMVSNTGTALSTVTGAVWDNGNLRIVDSGTDRSYSYSAATLYSGTGNVNATLNNALNASNLNATGITLVSTSTLLRPASTVSQPASGQVSMTAYPNPTGGVFKVRVEGPLAEVGVIRLFDLNGRLIGEQQLTLTYDSFREAEFDLSRQPAGLYMVTLISGSLHQSIVVSHQ
jgi:hypothetical protein